MYYYSYYEKFNYFFKKYYKIFLVFARATGVDSQINSKFLSFVGFLINRFLLNPICVEIYQLVEIELYMKNIRQF